MTIQRQSFPTVEPIPQSHFTVTGRQGRVLIHFEEYLRQPAPDCIAMMQEKPQIDRGTDSTAALPVEKVNI
jgi:hypothetical protein